LVATSGGTFCLHPWLRFNNWLVASVNWGWKFIDLSSWLSFAV